MYGSEASLVRWIECHSNIYLLFSGFQMSGIPWVFWPEPLELGGRNKF